MPPVAYPLEKINADETRAYARLRESNTGRIHRYNAAWRVNVYPDQRDADAVIQ